MATESQLLFVADIEAAVKAMTQDRQPVGVTIGEVLEFSNRDIHDIRGLVLRLAEKKEVELLKRIQAAFARVGVKQQTLEAKLAELEGRENMQTEPLKLEQKLPPEPEKKSIQASGKAPERVDEIEVVTRVLRILDPLPKGTQRKVINTASSYLGVGE